MLRKVFLQTQFGKPHPWTEQYFANFRMLAPHGWHLYVFTPNPLPSSENIEVIPMTLEEFDGWIARQCSVKVGNFIENGAPHKLVSDYYPAYGHIFQEFIKGFDFWGHTNWYMVYGRLDRFIPDSELQNCDIWADDINTINGIFTLYRNNAHVNNLFRLVDDWKNAFTSHEPQGFDEILMTRAVREAAARGEIRFKFPRHFPQHSYDRLIQHLPKPNLYFEEDGALIERFEDHTAAWNKILFPKGHFGREIAMFHFSRTKRWPL